MQQYLLLLAVGLLSTALGAQSADALRLSFERDSNETATYQEAIRFYEALAAAHPQLRLSTHGSTDSGYPLHLAVLATQGAWQPEIAREQGKLVLLINNAIHPGEPCGVDASMLLLRDFLQDEDKLALLDHIVILVIPFYNIGGGLNRGSYSRVNQQGPEAHGFRGNARNLDLNRDFIKCDSRNAQTFNQLFGHWQPDLLVDNHTSNGSDHQYTMTLIPSLSDKLSAPLASYLDEQLLPGLYAGMASAGWEMTPYVYARSSPDEGIAAFLDLPRYSTGYAALHHCIGFMPEAHALKPFKDRVLGTYAFMETLIQQACQDRQALLAARQAARRQAAAQDSFSLAWSLDMGRADSLLFKGYEAKEKPSEVSGLPRQYYDRQAPYTKPIPYFKYYRSTLKVKKPIAYLIPQAYGELIERLQWNGVLLHRLAEDRALPLELYRIGDFQTVDAPYEGHYLHTAVEVSPQPREWLYRRGDYVVFTDQPGSRYIVETLEPQAPDAFFAWNFFDGILMQKEYFSSHTFEDKAAALLASDTELRAALAAKRQSEPAFAASARAQLDFIYRHSPHYEATHRLYPVARLMVPTDLPLIKTEE